MSCDCRVTLTGVQVMERSYTLWGGEKGLDEEIKRREEAREKRKRKQYSKQIKGI